jgi:hypothetical protein
MTAAVLGKRSRRVLDEEGRSFHISRVESNIDKVSQRFHYLSPQPKEEHDAQHQ